MNRFLKYSLLLLLLLQAGGTRADEGMWMPGQLKQLRKELKQAGLRMSAKELYHPGRGGLTDAIVSFGGFCSGVVVSEEGLVLTNHHCGFSCVRQHSSLEHNYIRDGFVAATRADELPNPELYVRFLLRQEDVTRRVCSALTPGMSEEQRTCAVDSVTTLISEEATRRDTTLIAIVDSYYGGSEYWLSLYRDYEDVRLVYAPPTSVGKFGWDTDNWEWPRHTGDFCLFRIYASPDGKPAPYSPQNVPYRPARVASISLDGYQEGDYCMTLGYPGSTERYLSSYGIQEQMEGPKQAMSDIRGIKQAIWKREMERDEATRIHYASKYDESSNYWKHSIGTLRSIRRLHVLERKQAAEQELRQWIRQSPEADPSLAPLLTDLQLAYRQRSQASRALAYFNESFFNGPELVGLTLQTLNIDFNDEFDRVEQALKRLLEKYDAYHPDIDCQVLAALLEAYRSKVDAEWLPDCYERIDTLYGGNYHAFADSLYAQTQMTSPLALLHIVENDTTYQVAEDPAVDFCMDLLFKYMITISSQRTVTQRIDSLERRLTAAMRQMNYTRQAYPNANSTIRLSYGCVAGYRPTDGVEYAHYTTTQGIVEKVRAHRGDPDFEVQPDLLRLLAQGPYGRYADPTTGQMPVCFITDNDITGGNSGSAMFNAHGQLVGLAFDGNWEAMSSDYLYEPQLQRTIGVDIRYILFIMEQYGHAGHLVSEMTK